MRKPTLLAALIAALLCPEVRADQITLKNGDRLTGALIKADGQTLSLNSEYAGTVAVQWAAVEQITSDQPLYVTLKDGQLLVGTVAAAAGKLEISTRGAGKVAVAKDAVSTIRSPAEHAAYLAEIERYRDPGLGDLWSGAADAGLSATRGNADTVTIALGANAARATRRDKTTVYAASLFAKNSTTGVSLTTASAVRGGLRYDINLSERTFAFGFTDLEYDKFQNLDLRLILGGGLGWHAKKTDRTALDLFAGGSLNQEYFSTGVRRRSGEALFGEELSFQLLRNVALKERAVVFPNLSDRGEFRFTFDSSIVTKLTERLGWHLTLSDRYVSNPQPGIKKNDLLLSTGIRVSFGRP